MNVLFITGHPAQIHNFRIVKTELEQKGHKTAWLSTNKDISLYLLDYYKIKYSLLFKPKKNFLSRIRALIINSIHCIKIINNKNINLIISRVSPYGAIAGTMKRIPHIAIADTETSGIYDFIFSKFVTVFLSAYSFKRTLRHDQIRFHGNIELFYLHPKRFQSRDAYKLLNISKGDSYVVMRFVSWDAYHDKGLKGISDENKLKAVELFSKYAKVFISSEKELPENLKPYQIKIPPEKMHDVLANALLFFGESGTMASECAVLGTHAIYLDYYGRGYTDDEEKYNLVSNFGITQKDQKIAIKRGVELLERKNLKEEMGKNRMKYLSGKIDATKFLVWLIEYFPKSIKILKKNPEYQNEYQ